MVLLGASKRVSLLSLFMSWWPCVFIIVVGYDTKGLCKEYMDRINSSCEKSYVGSYGGVGGEVKWDTSP